MKRQAYGWSAARPGPGGGPVSVGTGQRLRPELADVGRLARRGMRAVVGAARVDERETLTDLLVSHLGGGSTELDVVEETWPGYEHVNVQAGLDAWLADAGRTSRLVGIVGHQHRPFGLGELLSDENRPGDPFGPRPGNAASVNLACGPDGAVRPCIRCGIYLVSQGDVRMAVLLRGAAPEYGQNHVSVQVMSTDSSAGRSAVAEIRARALEENVFRGQVLSFGQEVFGHGQTLLTFHRRPHLAAGQLVLPAATLVLAVTPYVSRIMRGSMVEVLESEYVTMARLKGLSERTVIWRHAVPNAVVPAIQVTALQLAWMAAAS